MDELTLGIIFGILSMVFWGISKPIIKEPLRKLGSRVCLIYQYLFMIILLWLFAFFTTKIIFPTINTFLLLLFTTLIGAIAIFFLFKAMKVGMMSVVLPVAYTYVIISVLLAFIFFKEKLSLIQLIGIVLLVLGCILVSFKLSELKKMKLKKALPGVKFALVTTIGWGVYFFLIKMIIDELGPLLAAAYLETFNAFFIGILFIFTLNKSRLTHLLKPGKKFFYIILISSVLVALGSFFLNMGLSLGKAAIVYPIAACSVLVSVVYSLIFLKEKIDINQKLAVVLVVLGIRFVLM